MPKTYTVGNGSMLVGFDGNGRVQDLYYPYVGQENHVGDDLCHRLAVRVDAQTYFLAGDFDVSGRGCDDTMAGTAVAVNNDIGIRIHFEDVVYNEKNVFLRSVRIENNASRQRSVTVYFCQEFQISQSDQANTAYYDPRRDVIVHYRGNRAFLINAFDDEGSFGDYTTGVFGIEGKAGSWQDAYDGQLSQNPIEHGPTDSCVSVTRKIPADSQHTLRYWIAAGESIQSVFDLDQYILEKTPQHIQKSTKDFWRAWLDRREFSFAELPDSARTLFRRSLLSIRSHISDNGAIIASSDSDMLQKGKDTYSYVWPRDGAHIAAALDRVGDWNIAQRFFDFADDVLSADGYFMHKFNPDKSLGSSWHPWMYEGEPQLPIQEDETGVVLHELWSHYDRSRDLEFIEDLYYPLIRRAADFMIGYRNDETGLPKASYDLWEEKIGVHTYTAASVYGGLRSASKIARLLGKNGDARTFDAIAGEIKQAMLEHLVVDGVFIKGYSGVGSLGQPDHTADISTVYGLYKYGVLPIDDERLEDTAEHVFAKLRLDTAVGGFARYEGDDYYRNEEHTDIPGNPWFIATLWHARFCINTADTLDDLKPAQEDFAWVIEHALASGVLSEQVDPYTGEQKSAAPLVWSHAEFIKALLAFEDAVEETKQ